MRLVVTIAILLLAGCRQAGRVTSQQRLAEASRLIGLGELEGAEAQLASLPQSADSNGSERWQTRVLQAEVAVLKRNPTAALALLADPPPPELADSPLSVRRLMLQASACTIVNDLGRAAELLTQASAAASRLDDKSLLADIEQRWALVALAQRQMDVGLARLERATALARAAGDKRLEMQALANRGVIEGRRGRFTEAIDSLQASLAIANAAGMRSAAGKILGNLGWCYRSIGDLEGAEEHLREAVKLATEYGLTGDRQAWLFNLGNIEMERHRLAEAQSYYLQAEAVKALEDPGAVYNNLTLTSIELGQLDEAAKYNRKATEINQTRPNSVSALHTRLLSARISLLRGESAAAESALHHLVSDSKSEPPVQWDAHAQLAALYRSARKSQEANREYALAIAAIAQARADVVRDEHRLAFLSARSRFYEEYVHFLMEEGRARDALAVVEFMRTRSLEERLGGAVSSRVPAASAMRAPGTKTVALVYWLSEPKSYLWCVHGSRVEHYQLPSRKQIESQVDDYRRVLLSPLFDEESARRRGQALYAAIVGPAQSHLRYGLRLAVVPDGALHRLDFGSLAVPGDELRFLIEEMPVAQMPALTLPSAAHGAAPTRMLLALGNAETDGVSVPPLPRSGVEMKAVASHFDTARTLIIERASAVPSAYAASHPDTFRFIHLAAHGTGNIVNPLESALLLSPEGSRYRLYAREILETPIRAEMVTVSACHGSGGRAYNGEGLVGLAWAFLRAGARNVIAALTEVSDTSTPRLMDRLYAEVASGKDPASALQAAKIELLRSGTIYRRPQYWAPFVAYARE